MLNEPYRTLREGAGLIDRSDRGRLTVTGQDRTGFLQGLLTNDIAALGSGEGCYAAYLTPQGRMIADLEVFNIGDAILLDVLLDVKDRLANRLDELVFSEDVRVTDWTESWTGLGVHGPTAREIIEAALVADGYETATLTAQTGRYQNQRFRVYGVSMIAARTDEFGELGFELYIERDGAEQLRKALRSAGAVDVDAESVNVARVETGRPKFSVDMNQETIPIEAGIEDEAISFTKGCYVGQELIIRIMHRGHGRVSRKLVGLTLEPDTQTPGAATVPAHGAVLWRPGEETKIGCITSAVFSPTLSKVIALGYMPRELAKSGAVVQVGMPGGRVQAVVTSRPFVSGRG